MRLRQEVARVVAAVALVVGSIGGIVPSVHPAGALTSNERFVHQLYQDFFLRQATPAEVAWGAALLQSQSRAAFVASFLASTSFHEVWIVGAYQRYVAKPPTTSQLSAAKTSLASTGDYLDVELDVLSSSYYFALAGGSNRELVDALYADLLWRVTDASAWDYWTGELDLGRKTRRQVAQLIVKSTEASGIRVRGLGSPPACPALALGSFDDIASGAYCILLDRLADPSGATYWTGQLAGSAQLPVLWSSLASSSEYYALAQ